MGCRWPKCSSPWMRQSLPVTPRQRTLSSIFAMLTLSLSYLSPRVWIFPLAMVTKATQSDCAGSRPKTQVVAAIGQAEFVRACLSWYQGATELIPIWQWRMFNSGSDHMYCIIMYDNVCVCVYIYIHTCIYVYVFAVNIYIYISCFSVAVAKE